MINVNKMTQIKIKQIILAVIIATAIVIGLMNLIQKEVKATCIKEIERPGINLCSICIEEYLKLGVNATTAIKYCDQVLADDPDILIKKCELRVKDDFDLYDFNGEPTKTSLWNIYFSGKLTGKLTIEGGEEWSCYINR